jgi:hypothetical protein
MKYIKILVVVLSFIGITAYSQTSMITSNIQNHLVDKYWSSDSADTSKVVFHFTQNNLSLFLNKSSVGSESYYLAEYNEVQTSTTFDSSKVGRTSSGNHIVTARIVYNIEFFNDYKSFRIKSILDPETKWKTYYLAEGFVPN